MLFSITMPDTGPYSSVKANVGSAVSTVSRPN